MRPDQAFERRMAELFRRAGYPYAGRTRASGALATEPGDLKGTEPWHVECKHSVSTHGIRVLWSALRKALREADGLGRWPLLVVGYGPGPWQLGRTSGCLTPIASGGAAAAASASRHFTRFTPEAFQWNEITLQVYDRIPTPEDCHWAQEQWYG